jgi:argininosuccinate lyase
VPFADAHEIAGACVRRCEADGLDLTDLSEDDLAEISPHLTAEVRSVLSVTGSINSRTGRGGTALVRVGEQLDEVGDAVSSVDAWLQP